MDYTAQGRKKDTEKCSLSFEEEHTYAPHYLEIASEISFDDSVQLPVLSRKGSSTQCIATSILSYDGIYCAKRYKEAHAKKELENKRNERSTNLSLVAEGYTKNDGRLVRLRKNVS